MCPREATIRLRTLDTGGAFHHADVELELVAN
jgi:hypothetical protein